MAAPLWIVCPGSVGYRRAWAWQRDLVERRAVGSVPDVVLLLEHPHVYTIGRRGTLADVLISPERLAQQGAEVVETDRGGQVTYHGPGQLVGYPIMQLEPPGDVWRLVATLEEALIATAARFGLHARGERGDATGVWVGEEKLAAIGMRVSRGITSHGFALNCDTDLARFQAIVPCGMPDKRACSLSSLLGRAVTVADVLPGLCDDLAVALGREPLLVDAATLGLPAGDHDPAAPEPAHA